jgi:predicted aspartyl protease
MHRGLRYMLVAAARAVGAAAFIVVMSAACLASAPDCHLKRYESLPITFDRAGGAVVPVTIDGKVQNLLIDTGGPASMLTQSAVSRLGLQPMHMDHGIYFTMYGGTTLDHYVNATIAFHGMRPARMPFIVMPDGALADGNDGTLGSDVLPVFELDFDFTDGKLNLISQDHCTGDVVYWTDGAYAKIPFKFGFNRHIEVEVTLNGKKVMALLDTGSAQSLMSADTAEALFGLAATKPGNRHFESLSFGGVTVLNPRIGLEPNDKTKVLEGRSWMPKLIIGMDVLKQLHLFISYKEKAVYATTAGAH